jgi:catechol 2,3-dioxygenase-like lactoylglutathione lyase family enzyme
VEQRVSLVTLGVVDLDRSRRFYEGLGWRRGNRDDGVVFFQIPGGVLALWDRAALVAETGLPDGSGFGGIALAYNARSRAEVDAVIAEAERAGARVLRRPAETFWGGYSGYFADPDGHPWEVAHNPAWSFDTQGGVVLPS